MLIFRNASEVRTSMDGDDMLRIQDFETGTWIDRYIDR